MYNTKREKVLRKHISSVTKPYIPMEIIDDEPQKMKRFLEDSYSVFIDKPELLKTNKYIINAYLDGKVQNDYLEQRGIKLAVVTELFKELLLNLKPEREYIIEERKLKKLKSDLKKAFKGVLEQSVDPNSRGKIYQNISGLNRTPFQEILSDFCEHIDLKVDDMQSIIDSRNSLIHTGKFFCQVGRDKFKDVKKYSQFQNLASEYFYLLNFVDKCILKLLSYKGHYINETNFKEEELL